MFFKPSRRDPIHAGRDPHEPVRTDMMGKRFPRMGHVAAAVFVAALALYLATMSWTPFPGPPTQALLQHLKQEATPAVLDSLWGWGVRAAGRLPGSVAVWTGLFSAVCGALAAALLARLMCRVAYVIRNEPGQQSFLREAQARRLSGLVAGLTLTGSLPFWTVSTRSMPEAFHVLWLLAAAWLFSQYQLSGRRRHLWVLGLVYGAGCTEFASFLVFAPVAAFLIGREMYRWKVLTSWRAHLALWGGLLPGLALYGVNAFVIYRQGLAAEVYASPVQALLAIWRAQLELAIRSRMSAGFLVMMFFAATPWLTLFTMSRRSPWFYEWGQIVVRLIFIGGLLAVLANASFAPWRLMGMRYLMVTPYVLMAVAMGYMAGEFWILGESHTLLDKTRLRRGLRRLSSAFALLLPLLVAAAALTNWRQVDGRHGRVLHQAARGILDAFEGPTILFTAGVLDDTLRVAIRESWSPVVLVSFPRSSSPPYLRRLAKSFRDESLRKPLEDLNFTLFLENLMLSEAGMRSAAFIDLPSLFREYGYLLPDGFVYRLQHEPPAREDLARRVASQQPFWNWVTGVTEQWPPEENPAHIYQKLMCLMASRVANNLGVQQAERGDVEGALGTFRQAWRMYPDNASALLNCLGACRRLGCPDEADYERDMDNRLLELDGQQWGLAMLFGHVWEARQWLDRGWVWALSGLPAVEEAAHLKPPRQEEEETAQTLLFDKVYLQWGVPQPDQVALRSRLVRDPRNTVALLALARLSLREYDFEAAQAYWVEAMAMGLPPDQVLFDRAMADYMRGDSAAALDALDDLSHLTPGDIRVWVALVLLSEPGDVLHEQALKTLGHHYAADAQTHAILGAFYLEQGDLEAARAELDRSVELDSRRVATWELMMRLATATGDSRLQEACLQAIAMRDPTHYLQFQNRGIEHYQRGEFEEAEWAFREAIRRRRDSTVLNNLAHVLVERGGNLQEALALVNEALRRQPGNAGILNTRAQVLIKLGRIPEARRDVVESVRRGTRNMAPLLDLVVHNQAAGNLGEARKLLRVAQALTNRMDVVQRQRIESLTESLGTAP